MGWLGWSEEQALASDVNAIEVAMRGKIAMLKAIFGSGKEAAVDPATLPEAGAGIFGAR